MQDLAASADVEKASLVAKFFKTEPGEYVEGDQFLDHTSRVNNWDLVGTSAPYILGEHFRMRSRRPLVTLAKSKSLWERRIVIVSILTLIKDGEIAEIFCIAEKLLADRHNLIHKAVGWALREIGKVSESQLLEFLELHYAMLPRTTLRYAIDAVFSFATEAPAGKF